MDVYLKNLLLIHASYVYTHTYKCETDYNQNHKQA